MRSFGVAVLLIWSTVAARADVAFDMIQLYGHAMKTCVAEARPTSDLSECRGKLVEACQRGEPFGYTVFGSSRCSFAEARMWSDVMEQELDGLLNWAERADAADASDPNAKKLYISRVENVTNAQEAWWAYRNSQCRLKRNIWHETRMAGSEESLCRLELVQERVSELRRIALDIR